VINAFRQEICFSGLTTSTPDCLEVRDEKLYDIKGTFNYKILLKSRNDPLLSGGERLETMDQNTRTSSKTMKLVDIKADDMPTIEFNEDEQLETVDQNMKQWYKRVVK